MNEKVFTSLFKPYAHARPKPSILDSELGNLFTPKPYVLFDSKFLRCH